MAGDVGEPGIFFTFVPDSFDDPITALQDVKLFGVRLQAPHTLTSLVQHNQWNLDRVGQLLHGYSKVRVPVE